METLLSINDLHHLRLKMLGYYFSTKPNQYIFKLLQLSDEENNRYNIYMNECSKECRKKTGSFLMSIGFAITIIFYIILLKQPVSIGLYDCVSLSGTIISAAMAGRVFQLLRARWKMLLLVSSLITRLSNNSYSLQKR